jgi:PAS domain-containing protein
MKEPSPITAGKKSAGDERRVHRSVPSGGAPIPISGPLPIAGVNLGSDTEILQKLVRQLRLERSFLQAVLDQMPVGVVLAEAPSGRLILGNRRMEELMKAPFFPALTVDQYSHWHGTRPNGSRYHPREWPLSRALLFGDEVRGEIIRVRRGDRSYGLFELSASPIRDEKGLIAAAVGSFHDVSERSWARQMFQGFVLDKDKPKPRAKKT